MVCMEWLRFPVMLSNWEGGCYALLTGKMSSKGLVSLESEIGYISTWFCYPVELLKFSSSLPKTLTSNIMKHLLCTLTVYFRRSLVVHVTFRT